MHAALRQEIEATAEDRWQPYGEDSGAVKECAWELLRVSYFPARTIKDSARRLVAWAYRHRIEIRFEERRTSVGMVAWVIFEAPGFKPTTPKHFRRRHKRRS